VNKLLSIKTAADRLSVSPWTVRLGRWVLLPGAELERLVAQSQKHGGQFPLDRTQLIAEDSSSLPSLLDNPLRTCNGSFDHAAREWRHHANCPAFRDEGGKPCGH